MDSLNGKSLEIYWSNLKTQHIKMCFIHHHLKPPMELSGEFMQFCPRGWVSPVYCSIYLECVNLNASKQRMGVCYSFNISEVEWCYDGGNTFKKGGGAKGLSKP
eukprot:541405_1